MTSPHFSDKELACPCCKVNEVKQELLDALEALRAIVGPITVDSAYRCQEHDLAVQGATDKPIINSVHVQGLAADIRVKGMTAAELYAATQKIQAFVTGGIGRDDHKVYLHVDVAVLPAVGRRWCYAEDGSWCKWYPISEDKEKGISA